MVLVQYINSGCLKRRDLYLSLLFPALPFYLNAKKVFKMLTGAGSKKKENKDKENVYKVSLEPYKKPDQGIDTLRNFLFDNLSDGLYGAYIHGSIANCEAIAYSDVDALVIIKDEVIENPGRLAKVAHKLNKALKYFYTIDPLQHHGWFVLTERDLKDYPQLYFPYELFQSSKSLFPDKGLHFNVHIYTDKQDFSAPFLRLAHSVIIKIEWERFPANIYQLKHLLSEFMLLPALYIQAKEKRGIYKKCSFDLAKKDFKEEEWRIMDDVSEIRQNWNYSLSPLQRKMLTINHPAIRKIAVRYFSPPIPPGIKKKLNPDFYQRIYDLCLTMMDKHDEHYLY